MADYWWLCYTDPNSVWRSISSSFYTQDFSLESKALVWRLYSKTDRFFPLYFWHKTDWEWNWGQLLSYELTIQPEDLSIIFPSVHWRKQWRIIWIHSSLHLLAINLWLLSWLISISGFVQLREHHHRFFRIQLPQCWGLCSKCSRTCRKWHPRTSPLTILWVYP